MGKRIWAIALTLLGASCTLDVGDSGIGGGGDEGDDSTAESGGVGDDDAAGGSAGDDGDDGDGGAADGSDGTDGADAGSSDGGDDGDSYDDTTCGCFGSACESEFPEAPCGDLAEACDGSVACLDDPNGSACANACEAVVEACRAPAMDPTQFPCRAALGRCGIWITLCHRLPTHDNTFMTCMQLIDDPEWCADWATMCEERWEECEPLYPEHAAPAWTYCVDEGPDSVSPHCYEQFLACEAGAEPDCSAVTEPPETCSCHLEFAMCSGKPAGLGWGDAECLAELQACNDTASEGTDCYAESLACHYCGDSLVPEG